MQKDANTILLFSGQRAAIDYLSDDDAGQLFKAIYAYADEGDLWLQPLDDNAKGVGARLVDGILLQHTGTAGTVAQAQHGTVD